MIGIFDSGVGGMTVARAVEKILPGYEMVYFGDLARSPYGSKSPETIAAYARENEEFLLDHGARIIIVACNSAASVLLGQQSSLLQQRIPVFEVVTPAVKKAAAASTTGSIGVIGTRATIRSNIYPDKIREIIPDARVYSQACPLLVPLVEEGWGNRRETKMIIRRYLHPLRLKNIDTLVLGCTHYPLLKNFIQPRIGKRVTIIDSADEVAAAVRDYLQHRPELAALLQSGKENTFYVSDVTESAGLTAASIFGRKINLRKIGI